MNPPFVAPAPTEPAIPPSFEVLPAGVPSKFVAHLGITAEMLEKLAAARISLEDAAARGLVTLPAPMSLDQFPQYLRTLKDWAEMGLDPDDPTLNDVVFEGSAEEAIRWLELEKEASCASSA